MLTTKEVIAKVARLQSKYAARDQRMRDVLSVRQGDISKVYPAMFSEEYPKPLVANFIDVAARDLAEVMAPLPSFNCAATNMVSDSARKAADTRTRIANYFVSGSELQIQMYQGADWFNTYGMLPAIVDMGTKPSARQQIQQGFLHEFHLQLYLQRNVFLNRDLQTVP